MAHRIRHQQNPRRNRVFRDKTNPLDFYEDFQLFERFRYRRHQLLEIIDDFRDELTHHFHQQGSISPEMQVLVALRFFCNGVFPDCCWRQHQHTQLYTQEVYIAFLRPYETGLICW